MQTYLTQNSHNAQEYKNKTMQFSDGRPEGSSQALYCKTKRYRQCLSAQYRNAPYCKSLVLWAPFYTL